MRKIILALALLVSASSSSVAQSISAVGNAHITDIDAKAFEILQLVVSALPKNDRKIAESVKIVVAPYGPDPGPRTGIDNYGNRVVVLPIIFGRLMQQVTDAFLLSKSFVGEHYPERWLSHWAFRQDGGAASRRYVGNRAESAIEYADLSSTQKSEFNKHYGQASELMYIAGLNDVLLHEIGHHVANALYDPSKASPSKSRKLEERADEWAQEAFRNFTEKYPGYDLIDQYNLIGRMTSLIFLREYEALGSVTGIRKPATHPLTEDRLHAAIEGSHCKTEQLSTKTSEMCELVREVATRLTEEVRDEAHYLSRAKKGEVFAKLQLAFFRGLRGDHASACKYFEDVVEASGELRAFNHVGDCYQAGFLGVNLPDADRLKLAFDNLCRAARSGWTDSRRQLEKLAAQQGWSETC